MGAMRAYTFYYNIVGGALSSAGDIKDPSGNSVSGVTFNGTAWSHSISGANIIINHGLGDTVITAVSYGINGTNTLVRTFNGTTTGQYSMFLTSATSLTLYSVTQSNAGFTGSGTGTYLSIKLLTIY